MFIGGNIYGNDVIERSTVIPDGALKSWILHERPLPAGRLQMFFIFVHRALDLGLPPEERSSVPIFMQVWRNVSIGTETTRFQLVYEREFSVNAFSADGLLYTVRFHMLVHMPKFLANFFDDLFSHELKGLTAVD